MSQLYMEKNDLGNVPDIPLPEGYVLRTYRPGDEHGLAQIYEASQLGTNTPEEVRSKILGDPRFTPERLFIVEHAGQPVGTAAAWVEKDDPQAGYLHMVGLLSNHRGKRLGALLTVAAIKQAYSEGFAVQRLHTDDWRDAAVRLYLDLGYYPVYTHRDHLARWRTLGTKLDRTAAVARAQDRRRWKLFGW